MIFFSSVQCPVEKVQDNDVLIANLQMADQVPDVTRKSDL